MCIRDRTYVVTIHRAYDDDRPSLSQAIRVYNTKDQEYELTPSFESNNLSYSLTIPYEENRVRVYVEAPTTGSGDNEYTYTIRINNNLVENKAVTEIGDLAVGDNLIVVELSSATTVKTRYVIVVKMCIRDRRL